MDYSPFKLRGDRMLAMNHHCNDDNETLIYWQWKCKEINEIHDCSSKLWKRRIMLQHVTQGILRRHRVSDHDSLLPCARVTLIRPTPITLLFININYTPFYHTSKKRVTIFFSFSAKILTTKLMLSFHPNYGQLLLKCCMNIRFDRIFFTKMSFWCQIFIIV